MALALLTYAVGVFLSIFRSQAAWAAPAANLIGATVPAERTAAWTGPLAILVIVAAMYGFTILGFELMQALPVVASGGSGH